MTFIQDIYLPVKNNTFIDTLLESLLEGVTPEQKELAQRAMAKKEMQIVNRLNNYFKIKWSKPKKTKEEYKQVQKEKKNFAQLLPLITKLSAAGANDKDLNAYTKRVLGIANQWLGEPSNYNGLVQKEGDWPLLNIITNKDVKDSTPADLGISEKDTSKVEAQIRQFAILHEYGHLFDWLKEAIETGYIPTPKGTVNLAKSRKYKGVEELEGSANDYALKNMYRKDRRKLLANSKYSDNEENLKSINNVKKAEKQTIDKLLLKDLYVSGTNKKSDQLHKTVNSINLQRANFSKELQKIQQYSNEVCEQYRKIGYKVPTVKCKIRDNYIKQNRDPSPLFSDPNGGKTIFVDIDAYKDLIKSKESVVFYLVHEIAHIITNKTNHEDPEYKKCVEDWNKKYDIKSDSDPDEKYNKKYLPTYYKKDKWYDKVPDEKTADKGMLYRSWAEDYFPY